MKVIATNDLRLILSFVNKTSLSLSDVEKLLDTFGDDYFIVDGEFVRTKENVAMKEYRLRYCKEDSTNG